MATKDRTTLKDEFKNGNLATGERFVDLIDSMKVVQLPVVDPQALGTSLSFIDSISQDADGKITVTKKTLDLANAHELNPFKGWYKTGDTLPTDGFDGAYLYFTDTSELTGQTTIYRWNGTTYADTGTVVDTSNVQTFGSGQAVNTVKIKDENGEEDPNAQGVLSAEAGKELNEQINGGVVESWDDVALTTGRYYNWNTAPTCEIGNDTSTKATGNGSGAACTAITMAKGEKYLIKGKKGTNYTVLMVVSNNEDEIIAYSDHGNAVQSQVAEISVELTSEGLLVLESVGETQTTFTTAPDLSGLEGVKIFVDMQSYNSETEYVKKRSLEEGDGIVHEIQQMNNQVVKIGSVDVGSVESLAAAIALVPENLRKPGLKVNYYNGANWVEKQFRGDSVEDWDNLNYWEDTVGDISELEQDVADIKEAVTIIPPATVVNGVSGFKEGYINSTGKSIGDSLSVVIGNVQYTSNSTAGVLKIDVNEGDTVTLKYKSYSNTALRSWILLDSNSVVLNWSDDGLVDTTITPLILHIEQDGTLLVQITQAYYDVNSASLQIVKQPKTEIINVVEKFNEIEDDEKVLICVPDKIFAICGDTLQLYYRSIFRCIDYSKYNVDVECAVGDMYPRYYELNPQYNPPIINQVGDYPITFTIRDKNNKILGQKTSTIVVKRVVSAPSSNLNILCVGASATQGGEWASELKRRLTANGGTPIGDELTNITFVGRNSVTFNGITVNLEATGGYAFGSYNQTGVREHKFYFTQQKQAGTFSVGDVYAYNGNNYTIGEINITDGIGNITCSGDVDVLSTSGGTLTRVSGDGTLSMEFASCKSVGNPFVKPSTNQVDLQWYMNKYCNGSSVDVVYTELFGNGTVPYSDDFASKMAAMQTFMDNVKSAFPNCKFAIGLFWNPDLKGGLGKNYHASGAWRNPYGLRYSNMGMCNALQDYINDNNLADSVFILNWLNEFDEDNDFNQISKPVNPRSSKTETFGTNGVHPSTVGYNQMADSAWRLFIAKFCQG